MHILVKNTTDISGTYIMKSTARFAAGAPVLAGRVPGHRGRGVAHHLREAREDRRFRGAGHSLR